MGYKVFVVAGDNTALSGLPAAVGGEIELVMLESSNEALWELQQNAPDAIVADLDLPGFSGLDLADLVPNFAPDTRIMLCARQPTGKLDAPSVNRMLVGEQTTQQIVAVLVELLAEPVPERAAPPPEPDPEPPPAPAPAPQPAPARSTSTSRTSAAPAPARASGPPPVSARPTTPTRSSAPPAVSARPGTPARNTPPQTVSPRPEPAPPRQAVSPRPEPAPPRQAVSPRPEPAPPRASAPPPRASAPPARASAPPPEPAAPPPDKAKKRAGGPLVVTAEILAPIRAKLKDLGLQLGAQATVLADRWGVPLVEEGRTTLPLPPFLPLLATSFSTMIDYTRQLHADEGSGLYMHEGNRYDIYIFDVGRQFLLVMIFDKQVASSKLGSVWLYAKRAVRELAEILEGE